MEDYEKNITISFLQRNFKFYKTMMERMDANLNYLFGIAFGYEATFRLNVAVNRQIF